MAARIGMHIGLPKTGTSSLQRLVFDKHAAVRHFGQSNIWKDADAKIVLRALLLEDTECAAAAPGIVDEAIANGRFPIISDEALTFGAYMLRGQSWPIVSDHRLIAGRARALLGNDVAVLMVLRNQQDWIRSWHRQGLKNARYIETEYDRWIERDLGNDAEQLFSLIDYDALHSAYCDAFNPSQVHVYLYEDFVSDFGLLAEQIFGDLGLAADGVRQLILSGENVTGDQFSGYGPAMRRFLGSPAGRVLKSILPKELRQALGSPLKRGREYEEMPQAAREAIHARFCESNARLFSRLGRTDIPKGYA